MQADTQRIIEVYHRNGRYDVSVVPKIIDLPNNRVDLVFSIKEGDKTGVKEIRFVGNQAYSDWRLEGRRSRRRKVTCSASCNQRRV